jgi:hypothetical protein
VLRRKKYASSEGYEHGQSHEDGNFQVKNIEVWNSDFKTALSDEKWAPVIQDFHHSEIVFLGIICCGNHGRVSCHTLIRIDVRNCVSATGTFG